VVVEHHILATRRHRRLDCELRTELKKGQFDTIYNCSHCILLVCGTITKSTNNTVYRQVMNSRLLKYSIMEFTVLK